MPGSEETVDDYQEAGDIGRNGHRPVETYDLQEEHTTGLSGGGEVKCIHGYPKGKGCYLCDPNHPYRLKEGAAT